MRGIVNEIFLDLLRNSFIYSSSVLPIVIVVAVVTTEENDELSVDFTFVCSLIINRPGPQLICIKVI